MLFHRRLEDLIVIAEDNILRTEMFFTTASKGQNNPGPHIRSDAPWSLLFDRVKQRLVKTYGENASVNLEHSQHSFDVIQECIMAATLLRRLIICWPLVGLGPAKAQVGDQLYFLKWGKTPFVLRATHAQPSLPGLKYEIVGDCYLHDLMDAGEFKIGSDGGWQDLSLL